MRDIGEDIVLLAIRRNGTIIAHEKLRFALAGWELVWLAQTRRIDIDHDGYIVVLDSSPTGDPIADSALAAIDDAIGPPRAKEWVARQRSTLVAVHEPRHEPPSLDAESSSCGREASAAHGSAD